MAKSSDYHFVSPLFNLNRDLKTTFPNDFIGKLEKMKGLVWLQAKVILTGLPSLPMLTFILPIILVATWHMALNTIKMEIIKMIWWLGLEWILGISISWGAGRNLVYSSHKILTNTLYQNWFTNKSNHNKLHSWAILCMTSKWQQIDNKNEVIMN